MFVACLVKVAYELKSHILVKGDAGRVWNGNANVRCGEILRAQERDQGGVESGADAGVTLLTGNIYRQLDAVIVCAARTVLGGVGVAHDPAVKLGHNVWATQEMF